MLACVYKQTTGKAVGGNEYFSAHPDEDAAHRDEDAGAAFVLQSKGIIIMVFFS